MKPHTTNYENTFIEIAEDCPVLSGEIPRARGTEKTIAALQFELIWENPYQFTSDDVLFQCFTFKNNIPLPKQAQAREAFFSKGQPCFRCSSLTKRYGFGVHNNEKGKIALYAVESEEYRMLSTNPELKIVKAMRNKRAY